MTSQSDLIDAQSDSNPYDDRKLTKSTLPDCNLVSYVLKLHDLCLLIALSSSSLPHNRPYKTLVIFCLVIISSKSAS